jgi:hypothetical protein
MYGLAFLGTPRSEAARTATPAPVPDRMPLVLLCLLCVASSVFSPQLADIAGQVIAGTRDVFLNSPVSPVVPVISMHGLDAGSLLLTVNTVALTLILLIALFASVRRLLLRGRVIAASPTWDCGYIAPNERMQYSAASFSQPAAFLLRAILRRKENLSLPDAYFPSGAKAAVASPDWMKEKGFVPLFRGTATFARWCKGLQHGRLNAYVLYIFLTLVALLAWKMV